MRHCVVAFIVAAGLVIVVACGGTETPFACGTTTCTGDEVCMHPCCGGAAPECLAADDAGTCPQNTTKASTFQDCVNFSTTNDCVPAACTPPPPYCAPKNSACMGYQQDPENCFEGCA